MTELRNELYRLVEDGSFERIFTTLHRKTASDPPVKNGRRNLAQVCKQLRTEYMPLLTKNIREIGITLSEAEAFFQLILRHDCCNVFLPRLASWTLLVDINADRNDPAWEDGFDILPLLEWTAEA